MIMSGVQKWSTMSPRTLISPWDQSADEFKIILRKFNNNACHTVYHNIKFNVRSHLGSGHSSLYVSLRLICWRGIKWAMAFENGSFSIPSGGKRRGI